MGALTDLTRDGDKPLFSLRGGPTKEQELRSQYTRTIELLARAPGDLARLNQDIISLEKEFRDTEAQSQSLTREADQIKSRIAALMADTAALNTMPDVVEIRVEQTALARAENHIETTRKAGRLLINLAAVKGSNVPADLRNLFSEQTQ